MLFDSSDKDNQETNPPNYSLMPIQQPILITDDLPLLPVNDDNNTEISITWKSTIKIIVMSGGIVILARVISGLGSFATSSMIARSTNDVQNQRDILAAGALIGNTQRLTIGIVSIGLTYFGNKIGSLYKNPQEQKKIGRMYRQSLIASCFFSVPPFLLLYFSADIFERMNQPLRPSQLCQDYFRSYAFGILFEFFTCNQQNLALSTERPWQAFYSSFSYTIIFTSMTYVLVINRGYGYKGLGAAAVVADAFSFFSLLIWQLQDKNLSKHKLYERSCDGFPTGGELKAFFSEGGTHSLQITIDLVVNLTMTILIGYKDNMDLDATQIAFQYLYLLLLPLANAVNAISYAVSQQANNINNAKKLRNITLGFSTSIPLAVLISSLIFPKKFILPFININDSNADSTIELAKYLLWFANLTLCFYIPRLTEGAYRRGLIKDTATALKSGIISNTISLGVGSLLFYLTPLSTKGFFIAKAIGEFIATSWLMSRPIETNNPTPLIQQSFFSSIKNRIYSIFTPSERTDFQLR